LAGAEVDDNRRQLIIAAVAFVAGLLLMIIRITML
jgi:hypothetical protein